MDQTSLIYRVLSGNASDAEKREFDAWVALNDANKAEFEDIKLLWDNSPDEDAVEHDDEYYEGLRKIMSEIRVREQRRKIQKAILHIALMAGLLTLIFFTSYFLSKQEKSGVSFKSKNVSPVSEMMYPHIFFNIHAFKYQT